MPNDLRAGKSRDAHRARQEGAIFDHLPDAIVLVGKDGKIRYANGQCRAVFGYEKGELRGQPIEALMPERFRRWHRRHRTDYNANPRVRMTGEGLELYGQRKGGEEFPVNIMLCPMPLAGESLVCVVIRDISERKRIEETKRQVQETLSAVVDAAQVAIICLDLEQRVTMWSSAAQEMFGFTADETTAQPYPIVPQGMEAQFGALVRRVLSGETIRNLEVKRLRKDGTLLDLRATATPLYERDGSIRGIAVTLEDITERNRTWEKLSQSEGQYQRLIDNLPGYVYICDNSKNWTMRFLSAGFREVVGLAPDDLVDNQKITIGNMIHPDDRERVWISEQENLAAHRPTELEYRIITPSGIEKWVWDHSVGVYDADGNVVHLEGYIEDITTIKQREHELHAARVQAEAANKAKSAFIANTSHEMRTPLNAVVGFSEMLAAERLGPLGNPEYREFAGLIENSARSLLAIVNAVMEISRMPSDTGMLDLEVIAPGEVIAPIVGKWSKQAIARGIEIELHNETEDVRLHADEQHLSKIANNVLSNAVKFSNDNGKVRVSLRFDRQQRFVLAVEDRGIGITPEHLPEVTKPFFQADKNFSRRTGGIGLGLALVKEYAKLHGATLNIASKPGKGTCVEVTFPATATVGKAIRKPPARPASAAKEKLSAAIG